MSSQDDVQLIDLKQAQQQLAELVERVSNGRRVMIAVAGRQVAELVSVRPTNSPTFSGWVNRATSEWRKIWEVSIRANQLLALGKADGEERFRELMKKNPEDGMVHYERGEALEYLKRHDEALAEYRAAQRLFPAQKWQHVAAASAERVKRGGQRERQPLEHDLQWRVFHLIHASPHLPHQVRYFGLAAVSRIDAEPEMATGTIRACKELLSKKGLTFSCSGAAATTISRLGNAALHEGVISDAGVRQVIKSFAFLLTDAESEMARKANP